MTHYTIQQWQAYIQGGELDRASMDSHLLACDDCNETYVLALEELHDDLPQLTNLSAIAESVLDQIKLVPLSNKNTHQHKANQKWYMNTMAHYTIAASLTVLLVGSGIFEQMIDRVSQISIDTEEAQQTSVSDQLTNKAGQWLDAIPAKHMKKEGKR